MFSQFLYFFFNEIHCISVLIFVKNKHFLVQQENE